MSKLDVFTSSDAFDEAIKIANEKDFSGAPDRAMFWAHTMSKQNQERNGLLCKQYILANNSQKPYPYHIGCLPVYFKSIKRYFSYHQIVHKEDILVNAWDIFSQAFAQAASGDHFFVAANDAKPDDWFQRCELPFLEGRFNNVTALEPDLNDQGELTFRTIEMPFEKWRTMQERQWQNHNHYLDGTPYKEELVITP